MSNNQETLSSYEMHVDEYINGTPGEVVGDVKVWIDATLQGLPSDVRILELGSAFGRDAAYIESLGYSVQRTDATQGFVDYLRKQGYVANLLNAITNELPASYDLIFADAVLLHFTPEDMKIVLGKVFQALNDDGRFSFSLKQGEGEEWSNAKLGAPRYFCYWKQDDIIELMKKVGFDTIEVSTGSLGRTNSEWLHIIAKKVS